MQELCPSLVLEVQDEEIILDFYILPLRGCDIVLGVQWLITVGPILWDFQNLTMQFQLGHMQIQWTGLKAGQVQVMTQKQSSKLATILGNDPYALLITENAIGSFNSMQMANVTSSTIPTNL